MSFKILLREQNYFFSSNWSIGWNQPHWQLKVANLGSLNPSEQNNIYKELYETK